MSSKNPLLPPKNRLDQSNGSISSELNFNNSPIEFRPKSYLRFSKAEIKYDSMLLVQIWKICLHT
jgi:hypothetical protein